MGSYIVKSANLREVVRQWRQLAQQLKPGHRFDLRESLFDHLEQPQFQRIQWFYYCDNDQGVTIRLYDRAFTAAHNGDYIDQDDCVLRGIGLGDEQDNLKRQMLALFDEHERRILSGGPDRRKTRSDFFEARNKPGKNGSGPPVKPPINPPPTAPVDLVESLVQLLPQFGQVILYGPPGTGKTRLARRAALALLRRDLTSKPAFSCPKCKQGIKINQDNAGKKVRCPNQPCGETVSLPRFDPVTREDEVERELAKFQEARRFDLVVFHPAYEYEQFVGGIAPTLGSGNSLQYQVKQGVFLELCREAEKHSSPVVLIIDEINRGNLPKLLGELVYALELPYRGSKVRLPFEYDGKSTLCVPRNLYVIATMNSSDRSIGHIDAAVRRRFALMRVGPDRRVVEDNWKKCVTAVYWPPAAGRPGPDRRVVEDSWKKAGDPARGALLAALMDELNADLARGEQGDEIGVGHSYFLCDPTLKEADGTVDLCKQVERKWDHQVRQLLEEYQHITTLKKTIKEYGADLRQILVGSTSGTISAEDLLEMPDQASQQGASGTAGDEGPVE